MKKTQLNRNTNLAEKPADADELHVDIFHRVCGGAVACRVPVGQLLALLGCAAGCGGGSARSGG